MKSLFNTDSTTLADARTAKGISGSPWDSTRGVYIHATEMPTITVQATDVTCFVDESESISVTASVSDGGILSYQWYVNVSDSTIGGLPIGGAISASYSVPTSDEGTMYYYCVITNKNNSALVERSVVSNTAVVSVNIPMYTVAYDANGGSGNVQEIGLLKVQSSL